MNDPSDPFASPDDRPDPDRAIGPLRLDEFVGQERLRARVSELVAVSRLRETALPHLLLCGPRGTGKRSLARAIARDLGVNLRLAAAREMHRPSDLAAILTSLDDREVLFMEDLEALNRNVSAELILPMTDCRLEVTIGKVPNQHTMRLSLRPFTLVGATERRRTVGPALVDAFSSVLPMDEYTEAQIAEITGRYAAEIGVDLGPGVAASIASVASGIPASSCRLVREAGAEAMELGLPAVTHDTLATVLRRRGIDQGYPGRPMRSGAAIPPQLRFRVLQRDGFRCQYCGRSARDGATLHLDHVVPFSAGGQTTEDNLITACEQCNLGKSADPVLPPD